MEKIWLKSYPASILKQVSLSEHGTLLHELSQACQQFRTQVCFSNFGVSLTFRQLDEWSDRFACFLQQEWGFQKGDRLAIQLPNVLQYPVILFGALKAGVIVVNTNPLYTPREMDHQFSDAGIRGLVILSHFAKQAEAYAKAHPELKILVTEIGDLFPAPKRWLYYAVIHHLQRRVPTYHLPGALSFRTALFQKTRGRIFQPVQVQPEDLAFLQYTGGTTGVSKGAMLTHRNVVANVEQAVEWMSPCFVMGKEKVITALPLYHIFSLTVNCFVMLRYGAQNFFITDPKNIPQFVQFLKRQPFSIFTGVNTLFNALMNHPDFEQIDFSHAKLSVAGGMALQPAVGERWMKKTRSPILEGYGLTEASPIVCCNPVDGNAQLGTIGLPFPSTDIAIRDETGKDLPCEVPGELCVKGPQVMQGYWKRPQETADILKDGWLHTGDIAVMQRDGFVKIVDRKKDMILVSGFNVYPNEIEVVVSAHPEVLEVAAIGVPDERTGEAVKLFVVKKQPTLSEKELITYCRQHLTAYKIPRQIEFCESLPKTYVGKILRRALKAS